MRGSAIAWLLAIARNLLLDAARRGRVADAARLKLGIAPISLDDEALERIEARGRVDVEASLARLPEPQRVAMVKRESRSVAPRRARRSRAIIAGGAIAHERPSARRESGGCLTNLRTIRRFVGHPLAASPKAIIPSSRAAQAN